MVNVWISVYWKTKYYFVKKCSRFFLYSLYSCEGFFDRSNQFLHLMKKIFATHWRSFRIKKLFSYAIKKNMRIMKNHPFFIFYSRKTVYFYKFSNAFIGIKYYLLKYPKICLKSEYLFFFFGHVIFENRLSGNNRSPTLTSNVLSIFEFHGILNF